MDNRLKDFFEAKSECTGCSACEAVCPKQCIRMLPDLLGFLYPEIDEENCAECFCCVKVCPVKNNTLIPLEEIINQ